MTKREHEQFVAAKAVIERVHRGEKADAQAPLGLTVFRTISALAKGH